MFYFVAFFAEVFCREFVEGDCINAHFTLVFLWLCVKYLFVWKKFSQVSSMYLIVVCCSCGNLLVADGEKKSRRCPYCGVRVWLVKARRLGTVETAREASELVRYLKRRKN